MMPVANNTQPSNRSKRKKKKTTNHKRAQKKHDITTTSIQEEIEQQLRLQRSQAPPPTNEPKRLRIGQYVYHDDKQAYFPVTTPRSKKPASEPVLPSKRKQTYPWLLCSTTVSSSTRHQWLHEWACRLLWQQSFLDTSSFPLISTSSNDHEYQLPPLWCRTFQVVPTVQPKEQQSFWILQQGHVSLQTAASVTTTSSDTSSPPPGHVYAVRLFANHRYRYTLEQQLEHEETIVYQADLEQDTYPARVHTRGEVYDVVRLSNGSVVYSYTGGRLECCPSLLKTPRMASDVLCLEEYRRNDNDNDNNNPLILLLGHRNGSISLWDVSKNRFPFTTREGTNSGPVVAIRCVPELHAILVQTATGAIHRYAVGEGESDPELVHEYTMMENAGPVRGMAVDRTVVWCPCLVSETGVAEIRLYSLETGQWLHSHQLPAVWIRLEMDPCSSSSGGFWIRAWNAQQQYQMVFLQTHSM